MSAPFAPHFNRQYETHLKHLRLKGLQPKTLEAYSRAIRRIGGYFDYQIADLSEAQLTDYFSDLLDTHSWSAIKLDLYGLKFFYAHVLHKPWTNLDLIKPPKAKRLPDIVTVEVMADYVENFRTGFVGLTGTLEQTSAAAKAYRVFFRKADEIDNEDYLVDHSSIVYLMDPNGQYLTHFTHASKPETMAEEMAKLVEG